MAKSHKHKRTPWFIKVRGSYLPNSWQGWLTYIPYTAYVVGAFTYTQIRHDDVWQTAFIVIPNWIAALAVMTWLAERTSTARSV